MKHKLHVLSLLAFTLLIWLSVSGQANQTAELVIGISKERAIEGKRYDEWLAHQHIAFRAIDLSTVHIDALPDTLAIVHALLLTGGADIYPGWYDQTADTARCGVFDRWRDTLEFEAFRIATNNGLPIMGICRGLQLINIAMGGTLYIDLPEDIGSGNLHRKQNGGWTTHEVSIAGQSTLARLAKSTLQLVASNHHQGIKTLGNGLIPSAFSSDKLIEAIENYPPHNHFLMAVQWHPEWMEYDDQLSAALARAFLEAALQFKAGQD